MVLTARTAGTTERQNLLHKYENMAWIHSPELTTGSMYFCVSLWVASTSECVRGVVPARRPVGREQMPSSLPSGGIWGRRGIGKLLLVEGAVANCQRSAGSLPFRKWCQPNAERGREDWWKTRIQSSDALWNGIGPGWWGARLH